MIFGTQIYEKKVISHYAEIWKSKGIDVDFSRGPINDLPKEFSVLEFALVLQKT